MFFEFRLNLNVLKINKIPYDLFNVIKFISNEMNKNANQNMIKMSKIGNIINNINKDNYKIFIYNNKYNI